MRALAHEGRRLNSLTHGGSGGGFRECASCMSLRHRQHQQHQRRRGQTQVVTRAAVRATMASPSSTRRPCECSSKRARGELQRRQTRERTQERRAGPRARVSCELVAVAHAQEQTQGCPPSVGEESQKGEGNEESAGGAALLRMKPAFEKV